MFSKKINYDDADLLVSISRSYKVKFWNFETDRHPSGKFDPQSSEPCDAEEITTPIVEKIVNFKIQTFKPILGLYILLFTRHHFQLSNGHDSKIISLMYFCYEALNALSLLDKSVDFEANVFLGCLNSDERAFCERVMNSKYRCDDAFSFEISKAEHQSEDDAAAQYDHCIASIARLMYSLDLPEEFLIGFEAFCMFKQLQTAPERFNPYFYGTSDVNKTGQVIPT